MEASVEYHQQPTRRRSNASAFSFSCSHSCIRFYVKCDAVIRWLTPVIFGVLVCVVIISGVYWSLGASSDIHQGNADKQTQRSYDNLLGMTALLFFVSLFCAVVFFCQWAAFTFGPRPVEMATLPSDTIEMPPPSRGRAATTTTEDEFRPKKPPVTDPDGMTLHLQDVDTGSGAATIVTV